jgi:GT2 family glycosyltransferase
MLDIAKQLKAHKDAYQCICINLSHLKDDDKHALDCMTQESMVMERDTGWFVKLYEVDGEPKSVEECYKQMYPGATDNLLSILCAVYRAGFRLIEFDIDALLVDELRVFDEY